MKEFSYRAAAHTDARRGFTLIELLVVVVITTALSSFLILYNHTSRQQIALSVDEAKLAQVIFRAKSLALSSYREPSSDICGYGVHIDYGAGKYALFSYTKQAGVECEDITSIDFALEQQMSLFSLNKELVFLSPPPGGGNRIDDVLFIPPQPVTFMNSGGTFLSSGSGKIALGTEDGSANAIITVNSAGLITF